jgi:5,6,7,8-tetrahydromethanopterin hydro-lyase
MGVTMLIAAVWANPAARNAGLVFANNRAATRQALRARAASLPPVAGIIAARHRPANPCYFAPPPADGAAA